MPSNRQTPHRFVVKNRTPLEFVKLFLAGSARLVHWIVDVSFIQATKGTMLILFILITGIVVGILPGLLKLDKNFSIANVVVGLVGALVGAFSGFGDAPLFLKYPFLNEITLMVAVSCLFVFIKVSIVRSRFRRRFDD